MGEKCAFIMDWMGRTICDNTQSDWYGENVSPDCFNCIYAKPRPEVEKP